MSDKINLELHVIEIMMVINELQQKLVSIFPKDKDYLLKHFAASSIHLTLFVQEFLEAYLPEFQSTQHPHMVKEFLKSCGCGMGEKSNGEEKHENH